MADQAKEIAKLNKQIADLNKQLGNKPLKPFDVGSINEAKAVVTGLKTELRDIVSDIGGIAAGFKNVVQELSKTSVPLKDAKKSFNNLSSLAQTLKNDQEGIEQMNQKQLVSLKEKIAKERENLKTTRDQLVTKSKTTGLSKEESAALTEINGILQGNDGLYRGLVATANKRLAKEKEINKALGATPAILGGISKSLSKLGLPDLGIGKAVEDTKKVLRAQKGRVTASKALSTVSSKIGASLKEQLSVSNLIQVAIVQLTAALKSSDKQTGELAKSLNISYSEANAIRGEFNTLAASSGELFVTTEGLQKSLMSINSTLGTNVEISDDQLTSFTKLREQAGLTNEELIGINSITNATGQDLMDITGEFLAQAKITATQNGAVLNERKLLSEINKISAATTLSLGKNPKELGKAAAAAKSFGMELNKVDAIASSLLNFEESIENELQAELLLGKNINLEKARQAALDNDLATLAAEIADQIGTAAEFGEMNRIQQEALAKSVGMSREELAQTLFVQEQIGGLSEKEAADREALLNKRIEEVGLAKAQEEIAKGEIKNLEEQNSIQESVNQSVKKLQGLFVSLADPILGFIQPIVEILIPAIEMVNFLVSPLIEGFRLLGGLVKAFTDGLKEGQPAAIGLAAAMAILARRTIASAIAGIFKAFSQIPLGIGIPLAIIAGAGLISMISKSQQSVKDGVAPASRGPFEITDRFGATAITATGDAMAVSPNLQMGGGTSTSAEVKETNRLLRQVAKSNEAIVNKQSSFNLDSTELFTSAAVGSFEIQ